jgi:hypothetical protein
LEYAGGDAALSNRRLLRLMSRQDETMPHICRATARAKKPTPESAGYSFQD